MKKNVVTAVIVLILILAPFSSFAKELLLNYDGVDHKYSGTVYKFKVNGSEINCDIPPVIINKNAFVPVRAAFESLGATLKWDLKIQKFYIKLGTTKLEFKTNSSSVAFNDKTVKLDTPAKLITGRLFIPVSFFSQNLKMAVGLFPEKGLITLDNKITPTTVDTKSTQQPGSLENVNYTLKDNQCQVVIKLSNFQDYKTLTLPNPDRIVIDVTNVQLKASQLKTEQQKISVSSNFLKAIRYSQFDSKTMRIVLDVSAKTKYEVLKKDNSLILNIVGSVPTTSRGGEVDRDVIGDNSDIKNPSNSDNEEVTNETPASGNENPSANTNGQSGNVVASVGVGFDIKYKSNNGKDEISITTSDYSNYKVVALDNPSRIVIDIPYKNGSTAEQKVNINGSLISAVRYCQYSDDILRIVLDVAGQSEYDVLENKGELVVGVRSKFKNLSYSYIGDRASLIINNSKLTEGGGTLKKFYTETYDETGKKYIIAFPNSIVSLDNGIIKINDNVLNTIEIVKDAATTQIIFSAKDKFYYNVFSRSELNDTAITILKPFTKADRLVVIDPGHGGTEPGAMSGGVNEKDLNLDIALRLNTLLKSKNIKTYILRSDDRNLGLYERTSIANNLNATLFISVHNNAFNSSEKGTETLYNFAGADNGSFNSKKLAQIIQTSMINALGSLDRKIVYRPNLVVLKGTTMPAALAEVGFITNPDERAKLLTDEYKQKAAQALCDSIIESLTLMNP